MTTPDPLPPGQFRTSDALVVALRPGTYSDLTVGQSVADATGLIASVATSAVSLEIVDPSAGPLPADEILAVYPPAGAEDATDVMLPHIALRSRALPWACTPIAGSKTWLALVVFRDGEVSFNSTGTSATARVDLLKRILPTRPEFELLCHVRELPADDLLAARDDDRFVAIVVANRLPAAAATCHACLVDLRSLENGPVWNPAPGPAQVAFVNFKLLHHWSFKTAAGGDFEEYWKRLRNPGPNNPTGGVQAFGQGSDGNPLGDDDGGLDLAAPLPDDLARRVRYHGPLGPLARDLAVDPADSADAALGLAPDGVEVVGHAAAFELGRLLALSNPRVLDALLGFRQNQFERDLDPVLHTPVAQNPGLLDFRGNWRDVFDNTGDWFGGVKQDLWSRTGDPTGILALVGTIPGLSAGDLADLGGLQLTQRLATLQNPGNFAPSGPEMPLGMPDLGGIVLGDPGLGFVLESQFVDLQAAVAAISLDIEKDLP